MWSLHLIKMNYITSNVTDILVALNVLDGTLPSHVYSITFFVPIVSLLVTAITASATLPSRFKAYIEVILINCTLLLALTTPFCCYSFLLVLTLIMILCTALMHISFQVQTSLYPFIKNIILEVQPLNDFNQKFIGDYRGHLLFATSVCILAVDFDNFPMWFSKTETYGWSVMDAGVGSFVFVNGLCSSSARKSIVAQNSFKKCILSSIPLFILGVVRLVVTTAVGYHKVVSEYGVHWNFFFTLALVKVICYVFSACFFFIPPGVMGVMVLVLHQTLLSGGFTELVLSDFRRNLFEANKEGICSLLGFVSIYFFGVQTGLFLWEKRNKIVDYIFLLIKLFVFGICGWILMYIIDDHIQPVSRKMANSSYCIWVVTLTSLQIALHLIHQILTFIIGKVFHKDFSECLLWKAINYNGLFYFLLSNVLTGLVNISIKTQNCHHVLSLFIVMLYLACLNLSVIILYKKSVQLKFW